MIYWISRATGAIRLSNGTLRWATGNTSDISARTVTIDSGGATFDTNGNNFTLANAVGNSGSGSLTKTGIDTLTLDGSNIYIGATTVSLGTLALTNLNAVAGNIVNNATVALKATGTFDNAISGTGNVTYAAPGTLNLQSALTHTDGTSITQGFLSINTGGSLSGNVAMSGASGTGLFFNNTITFGGNITGSEKGTTTISGGSLQIGNGGAAGSVVGNIVNNSALIFNRSDAVTYAGAISGTGTLTKLAAYTLTLRKRGLLSPIVIRIRPRSFRMSQCPIWLATC